MRNKAAAPYGTKAVISRKRLCELCVFNFAAFAVKSKAKPAKGAEGRPELLSPARRACDRVCRFLHADACSL